MTAPSEREPVKPPSLREGDREAVEGVIMTNFDIFLASPKLASFAEVAVSAEKIYQIDPAACVLNCRRAMEFAVKWMYSVDEALKLPWDDKLVSLMSTDEFRDVVDDNLLRRMHFIRKLGNTAAHAGSRISREQAALCLENLYIFLDFVAYCYGDNYEEREFDPKLLTPSTASRSPSLEEGGKALFRHQKAPSQRELARSA